MTEIISILLQFLIFLIIFSFPFNNRLLCSVLNLKNGSLNLTDVQAINIIFFIYLSLIVSISGLNIELFFKIYLFFSIIFILINFKKNIIIINKSNLLKFLSFFLISISIFFFIAQNLKLEWDGHVWIQKALIFFNNENISNLNQTVHSDYPHLGSFIWAFFWKNSLLEYEFFGRYFNVYLYVISIFLIFNISNIKDFNFKIIFILFLILITFEPYYFAGYQEYLIFSTLVIASRYILLLGLSNFKNTKLIILIILILFLNCWFKNEGKAYFLIFTFPLLFMINISNYKKLLLIFLVSSLLVVQYLVQLYLIQNYNSTGSDIIVNFFQNIGEIKLLIIKIFKISIHIVIAFIKHSLWLVILLSFLFNKLISKKIDFYSRYFLICFGLNMLLIFFVYISLNNIDFFLKVTLDRVIFQTSGFYITIFILVLNKFKDKFYK